MRIGIVTCETLPEPDYDDPFLTSALVESGHEPVPVPWDGEARLEGLDLLLIRSCWNYYESPGPFLAWIQDAAGRLPLFNPAEIVSWNAHKGYLEDLRRQGVPVVPTAHVPRGSALDVAALSVGQGWPGVVIKPAVSAGSFRTQVFEAAGSGEAQSFLDGLVKDVDAMVQPLLSSVLDRGERSVVWFGGECSHAVVKRPRFAGDEESVVDGGRPTELEAGLVERCLSGLKGVLYARLDLMEMSGEWMVSELELIEPSLYFYLAPGTAEKFVAAVERAVAAV